MYTTYICIYIYIYMYICIYIICNNRNGYGISDAVLLIRNKRRSFIYINGVNGGNSNDANGVRNKMFM